MGEVNSPHTVETIRLKTMGTYPKIATITSLLAKVLLTCILCSAIASGQQSQVMQDFYRLEQENWRAYIEASRAVSTQGNFDVTFYHLSVDLGIASPYLTGTVLCRFRSVEDSTRTIKLNLRREFTIDSIRGDAAGFTFSLDTITVSLDHTFQTGDTGSVCVYYRGVPPVAGGLKGLRYVTHATNQRVIVSLSTPFLSYYWWPCKDGPGDKPDSVYVEITIPDTSIAGIPVVAVSNGLLAGVVSAGGKKTFQWRERYPIVPYYVMAAVSNYRDFHQTFTGTHGEQFPMDYYVFNEHLTAAQQGVADMPLVMAAFSDRFGVYPFSAEKYGMTQLGFYGAIENQTNTIINNMGSSYFGISVHELAHMWFGDMITCKDWHHGWLNEGFATYAEALWAEHTGGLSSYLSYVQNFRFLAGGTLYLQEISDPFAIFVPIIYDKGACVLHMLRGVLGDSVFFACLSSYAGDPAFRYGHATTEDFQGVCESVSQRDLDFFFTQWVYDQYYPMYEYTYSQDGGTGDVTVGIRQTQSTLGRRAVFEMPVRLKFLFQGGGDTTVTVWNSQQVQSFTLQLPRPVVSMQFDPDNWILRTAQVVSVNEGQEPELPLAFALEQNYPNPFNPTTTIQFTIVNPRPSRPSDAPSVTVGRGQSTIVKVYDVLGRQVATLVNEMKEPGTYAVRFDARDLASGMYYYRLRAGSFVQTRKMTVVK
jgi:aminopeptidase N